MDSTDKELEEQLLEAGNKLVDPPSSVDELLLVLDQVESCLSKVEQSPSKPVQNALSPSLKALIADKLVRHSNVDVKVTVASCLSEITRIAAPEAPYNDDQMKDIFRLIVSSFENLNDMSSRSYKKRTSILETVSKVRSCVVMLDLECDALILEMFQHFLKTIREDHPENVFSSMETIMTLVLEESEDISLELLSPILASVKKNNEDFLPIAQKLGERVLESCAAKIKPYLVQAVNILGISLDDYSDVLASICQDASGNVEQNDVCATSDHVDDECKSAEEPVEESAQVDESKSAEEPVEEAAQVVSENTKDVPPPQQDNPVGDRSPKSVMTNGIAQAGEDEVLADSKSLKKQDGTDSSVLSKSNDLPANEEPDDLNPVKVHSKKKKSKLKQGSKRKRRKPSSSKLTVPSEVSNLVIEKEAEKPIDSKSHSKEGPSSPNEDGVVEAERSLENDKETNAKISSPKAGDGESDAGASSSPSESNRDENLSKGHGRTKKKDIFVRDVAAEDVLKKVSEGTSDSEVKPKRPSVKKGLGRSSDVKITTAIDAVKKGSGKTKEKNKGGGGSSSRKTEDKKRKREEKGNSEKGLAKSSAKDEDREMASSLKSALKSAKDEHSEKTPKTNLKRKRTPGKQKESGNKKYDESLVGVRVKVWWPDDEMFYKGVIDSYDSSAKKHKVSYDDGDLEILNLEEEKWEKIIDDDDAGPDGEEGSHRTIPDAAADMPPKKKGKRNAVESKKEVKRDSSKSGGTSSKSKAAASTKSSHKSKTVDKSEDEVPKKSKDHFLKSGGKSNDTAQKSKSKNTDSSKVSKSKDDVITPKPSAKSKQETLKTGKSKQESSKIASSSKSKSSKSGKSNTKSSGKVKSSLLKIKDSESENSDDSSTEIEDTKVKMLSSSKAGKMKSSLLKAKDSENESSDESTEEDTKVKMLSSSKSGKKRARN